MLPLLKPALAAGGDLSMSDVYAFIKSGAWQLWLATIGTEVTCALVTQIAVDGEKRAFRAMAVGGRLPPMWRKIVSDLEWLAMAQGCTHSEIGEGYARKGWQRLLSKPRELRKELSDAP